MDLYYFELFLGLKIKYQKSSITLEEGVVDYLLFPRFLDVQFSISL